MYKTKLLYYSKDNDSYNNVHMLNHRNGPACNTETRNWWKRYYLYSLFFFSNGKTTLGNYVYNQLLKHIGLDATFWSLTAYWGCRFTLIEQNFSGNCIELFFRPSLSGVKQGPSFICAITGLLAVNNVICILHGVHPEQQTLQ